MSDAEATGGQRSWTKRGSVWEWTLWSDALVLSVGRRIVVAEQYRSYLKERLIPAIVQILRTYAAVGRKPQRP